MKKRKFLIIVSMLLALVAASWGVSLSWGGQKIPKAKWNKIVKAPALPDNVSWRNQAWFEVQKAKIERNQLILQERGIGKRK
jgi:hypothetical protein